ncbi:MAG: NAD-dependent succinate-semialdehyde dehydrogenase [Bifidobacteriaceae bacterium]|jgi:succinate-semialdehyde dehydrogenase/glutarate-semialdehyde dehydrogenase|nr:NAD-dependent succinate-semialdehyde dehydrogenase [Bifidobacteriaceae bacterium]
MSADPPPLPNGLNFQLFIDGSWRPAHDNAKFDVVNPSNEQAIGEVASAAPQDAVAAVEAAERALPAWSATPPRQRGEVLRAAYARMIDRLEEIAVLISIENGKALPDARAEVRYAAEFFRWFSEEAVRLAGDVRIAPSGDYRIVVQRQPIGVCALVTPWNYPAAMATRKIGPALAAGCTVVLKPASDTPLTALLLADLLQEAGVPPGVVNVLPSRRSGQVVQTLLAQRPVRKVSFTGSTEVGVTLLHGAADRVISSSMELGGNAPFLVFEDADIDAAVGGAMIAKIRNGGEACTAANRFYVHDAVADEFTAKFAAAMSNLRIGPGYAPGVELGPVINAAARSNVAALVDDALTRGAQIFSQGAVPDGPGYWVAPAVLVDVHPDSRMLAEEIFAPVAPVVRFATEADAISLANATEFGLISYLYTRDLRRGLRVAESLEAGMIGLNRGLVSDPSAPFGGVKQSGLGREGGHEGIAEYAEEKYIATEW